MQGSCEAIIIIIILNLVLLIWSLISGNVTLSWDAQDSVWVCDLGFNVKSFKHELKQIWAIKAWGYWSYF